MKKLVLIAGVLALSACQAEQAEEPAAEEAEAAAPGDGSKLADDGELNEGTYEATLNDGNAAPTNCATTSVQIELNECALAEYEKADEALNRQWVIVFRRMSTTSRSEADLLRQAQREWIALRDSRCDAEYPWDLGVSLDKMLNVNCRTEMTEARTNFLMQLDPER